MSKRAVGEKLTNVLEDRTRKYQLRHWIDGATSFWTLEKPPIKTIRLVFQSGISFGPKAG